MKLLFAHSSVKELLEATNEDTIGIEYDESTSTSLLMETLKSYPTADRLGFAFHFGQTFMNQEELFSDSDLLPNAQYSRNVQFIIDLIRNYEVVHVDFLACSTLLDERWKQFYAILHLETGVVVGASDDNTGNLKYGGDWIMESTQEDVSQIYFNDTIVNFAKVLFNSIVNGTSVAVRAYYNTNVTSVVIGTTVTSIGNEAFMYCSTLKSITFNATSTLKTIGTDVFLRTGLIVVEIPNSVISLGAGAFYYCQSLTRILIPTTIKRIGNYTFAECTALSGIEIPSSVTSIGDYAFERCKITYADLSNVNSFGTQPFKSCDRLTTMSLPTFITDIPNFWCYGCTSLTNFIFLSNRIKFIGLYAFYGCTSLTNNVFSNIISSGVTNISSWAFENCTGLTNLIIPNSVTTIDGLAFLGCINLTQVTIPSSVSILGTNAFLNTGITSLIRNQLTNNAYYKYIDNITDRSAVTNIFSSWSLTSTSWRKLEHTISFNKTRVVVGESCTVTFTINPELFSALGATTYSITGLDNTAISGTLSGNLVSGINMVTLTVLNETAFNVPLTINLSDGTTQTFTLSLKTMPKNQKVQTCFSRF